jgi:hypothetical protein
MIKTLTLSVVPFFNARLTNVSHATSTSPFTRNDVRAMSITSWYLHNIEKNRKNNISIGHECSWWNTQIKQKHHKRFCTSLVFGYLGSGRKVTNTTNMQHANRCHVRHHVKQTVTGQHHEFRALCNGLAGDVRSTDDEITRVPATVGPQRWIWMGGFGIHVSKSSEKVRRNKKKRTKTKEMFFFQISFCTDTTNETKICVQQCVEHEKYKENNHTWTRPTNPWFFFASQNHRLLLFLIFQGIGILIRLDCIRMAGAAWTSAPLCHGRREWLPNPRHWQTTTCCGWRGRGRRCCHWFPRNTCRNFYTLAGWTNGHRFDCFDFSTGSKCEDANCVLKTTTSPSHHGHRTRQKKQRPRRPRRPPATQQRNKINKNISMGQGRFL